MIKQQMLVSTLSLLLVCCSSDPGDLVSYITKVKDRKSGSIEPMPVFARLAVFKFANNESRRSPFMPVNSRKRIDSLAPSQNRQKQALEAFPLDTLRFVGTLSQNSEIWALIKQPDLQITHVRVGDYMGQNYGRIQLIEHDLIQLVETIKNSGAWEHHVTLLKLVDKQE